MSLRKLLTSKILKAVLSLVASLVLAQNVRADTNTTRDLMGLGMPGALAKEINDSFIHSIPSFYVDTGPNTALVGNTAAGYNVLRNLVRATSNFDLGNPPETISASTSATENTGLGTEALRESTYASDSTCIGSRSCRDQTRAYYNTGIGHYSLGFNRLGWKNTALGAFALQGIESTSDPQQNTAIGFRSQATATTAQYNTSVGNDTLYNNRTGIRNTAIGDSALLSTVNGGDGNVGVGQSALYELTTGDNNTVVGYESGRSLTTGSGNLILGPNITVSAALANNIILANGAGIKAQHDATDWTLTGGVVSTLGFRPPSLADGSAANNTIYYSTTASKLVYKDSGGVVNNLY